MAYSVRRWDASGRQIGSTLNSTFAASVGFNRIGITLADSNDLYRLDWHLRGTSTATGVKLLGMVLTSYENPVKNV